MRTSGWILCSLFLLGSVAPGGSIRAAEDEENPCLIGGFELGGPAPDVKDKAQFRKSRPSIFKAPAMTFYQSLAPTGSYSQYIGVFRGKLVAIVREYEGDDVPLVYSALNDKYGEAEAGDLVPRVKGTYAPFGGSVKMETSAYWKDSTCEFDIRLTKQSKTVITGFGGGTGERATVVWTKATTTDSGKSSLVE